MLCTKFLRNCLMTLSLMLCAGCAPEVVHVIMAPPSELMQECPHPQAPESMMRGSLRDYAAGATRHIIDYAEALDLCNAQLTGLREWRKAVDEAAQ